MPPAFRLSPWYHPGNRASLDDAVIRQRLIEPGFLEPTPERDKERSNDRLWS